MIVHVQLSGVQHHPREHGLLRLCMGGLSFCLRSFTLSMAGAFSPSVQGYVNKSFSERGACAFEGGGTVAFGQSGVSNSRVIRAGTLDPCSEGPPAPCGAVSTTREFLGVLFGMYFYK